jgi:hypothetical protein
MTASEATGQDFVNTSFRGFQGGIEALETTYREISVQQFLQHLHGGYDFAPALPGFQKDGLRLRSQGIGPPDCIHDDITVEEERLTAGLQRQGREYSATRRNAAVELSA